MSWTEILINYNDTELKKDEIERLNAKFELQFTQYIVEILSSKVCFSVKANDLCIQLEEKEITKDEFIFWWQITRYNQVTEDQLRIKNKINEINQKLTKIAKLYPSENENDDTETIEKKKLKKEELDKKKNKIIEFMKKDEFNVKRKLALLNNFKLLYPSIDSLHNLLKNIKLFIQYSDLRK